MKTYEELINYLKESNGVEVAKRFARRQGVYLDMNSKGKKNWNVNYITRQAGEVAAEKGSGTKVLRAINKLADRDGKNVNLVSLHPNLTQKVYAPIGYKAKSKKDPDTLVRKPNLNEDQ